MNAESESAWVNKLWQHFVPCHSNQAYSPALGSVTVSPLDLDALLLSLSPSRLTFMMMHVEVELEVTYELSSRLDYITLHYQIFLLGM